MTAILGNTGYFVGIGIEVFIILVCAALLALMLTGLLFKWTAQLSQTRLVKAEARAADREAWAIIEEERAAKAAAEAEAERARAEAEAMVKAEAEAAAAEAAAVAAAKQAEEEAKNKPKLQPKLEKVEKTEIAEETETVTEKEVVKERIIEKVLIVEQQKAAEPEVVVEQPVVVEETVVQEAAVADAEEEEEQAEGENGFVVVQDGIIFNDSKTITELYEELSPEQQSYFDELREEALTKPDAELAIAKNFVTVKIGKRNLIKLLIKRGVTVAEFVLENEALKQLRLSNTNKRGKSAIKIKPTVVQVLDLASLKVAVDMINLSYEEIMMD